MKALLSFALISQLSLATLTAVACAALSVWMSGVRLGALGLVPFSAGILVGLAAFGIWPELAGQFGWAGGLVLLTSGFALLWVVNRYVYPVCPSCAHTHNHDACAVTLHGFALPLIVAGGLHSFMDGWGISASQSEGGLGTAILAGVLLHKIPEGLAYGAMLRASLKSRFGALAWCALIQSPTLVGGWTESLVAPHLGPAWIGYPLAIAGGSFLFLGLHAVDGEWKRRGARTAFGPALTGAAGAAVLQTGLRVLLR